MRSGGFVINLRSCPPFYTSSGTGTAAMRASMTRKLQCKPLYRVRFYTAISCCGEWSGLPPGYGPSLGRGHKPHSDLPATTLTGVPVQPLASSPNTCPEQLANSISEDEVGVEDSQFDRKQFTRWYNIAALRVAADECWSLMQRIKGHLLNWPRLKNVARVPGDDVDARMQHFFWNSEENIPDIVQSVRQAVYGKDSFSREVDAEYEQNAPMKDFGTSGRLAFPALEELSRLKRHERNLLRASKKGKGRRKERNCPGEGDEDNFVTVEVLENNDYVDHEQSEVNVWRGPTRLLLLDERHAGKSIDELPMAVQAALSRSLNGDRRKVCELVQCRVSLHYAYWPLDEILGELLPAGIPVPSAFETVGHIAHLNLDYEHLPYRFVIAQVILDKHFPQIRSVVNKTDVIRNQYRTMELELLAGRSSLITTVVEHGLIFHVDISTVYWNTRLATERQRLLETFDNMDIICDVFAGVGPLAVAAAKKVKRVYANDLNPSALKYLAKNIVQNHVSAKVEIFNLDGKEFIREILTLKPPLHPTHFVMNLPSDSLHFLSAFRGAFRKANWNVKQPLPRVHIYGFSNSSEPENEFTQRLVLTLGEDPPSLEVHLVRLVAPKKWMLRASFQIPESFRYSSEH